MSHPTRRPAPLVSLLPLLALLLLVPVGCGDSDKPQDDAAGTPRPTRDVPHVYCTFLPTTWMASELAGDKARVFCPVPEDADPIHWEPSRVALSLYQEEADLIVVNGAGFEKWVETVSLPESRIVDTAKSFEAEFMEYGGDGAKHSHGDGPAHSHSGVDGHTWVDPTLAIKQATAIKDALVAGWPQHEDAYESGFAALKERLEALDKAFRALGSQPEGTWLHCSHPAYNYIARAMGWRIHNWDLDPGSMPSDAAFEDIKNALELRPGHYMLWEGAPTDEIAKALKEKTGLESLVISPCETAEDGVDYLARMQENVETLRPAFAPR